MIGYIQGTILSKDNETFQCLILSQTIGYEVSITPPYFESLNVNDTVSLWLHTVVREDAFLLYGFSSEAEKIYFRKLLSVSGLGPKSALSLLGEHGVQHLTQLILDKNAGEISSAPGIGKKTAQRIVLDLEPKIQKWAWLEKVNEGTAPKKTSPGQQHRALKEDLGSALANLGYVPNHIKMALEKVFSLDELKIDFETGLRIALKELSNRPVT